MGKVLGIIVAVACVTLVGVATGQDWDAVTLMRHDAYQAVNADGSSAYSGGFPIRLRGVLLNNAEDLWDSTPNYNEIPGNMGGEWEVYVQAFDDAIETYDDGDIGGTAVWMGQCYGNLGFIGDPFFSYSDSAWLDELYRISHDADTGVEIRAGDMIEVRARGGLSYKGKMNVNEQHTNGPANDFEIVILAEDFGLPTPTPIGLDAIKYPNDVTIWDATRQTGGERYQGSLVQIRDVSFADATNWAAEADLLLTDATGRTLPVHLGRNDSFDTTPAPDGPFHVVGVMDQDDASGLGTDGYRLLVFNAADFTPALPTLIASDPATDGTLSKRANNVIRLTFDAPIALPIGAALTVAAAGGADLASQFTYAVDADGVTLVATEDGSVLANQTWYQVTPSAALAVVEFAVDLCALVGDADGNGQVMALDLGLIWSHNGEQTNERYDIDGNGQVMALDLGAAWAHNGQATPTKPW